MTVRYQLLDFLGFAGYRVGDDGSVWSRWGKKSLGGRRGTRAVLTDEWVRLSSKPRRGGYQFFALRQATESSHRSVAVRGHTLVLVAFVGPRPDGMEACHVDGNPANNRLDNLRWGTSKSNHADQLRHGTRCRGERKANAVLTADDVLEIRRRLDAGELPSAVAADFDVSTKHIRNIRSGRFWAWLTPAASCGESTGGCG